MGDKDLTEKILEAYSDVFADMANGLMFEGKPVILAEELVERSARSYYKVDGRLHEIERDVVKHWRKGNINIACIGIENQTAIDFTMPLRVIEYDGAEYRKQLLHGSDNLYPVATMVLYFGLKPWTGPRSLKECLGELPEDIAPYVNDYKIHLYEIAYLSHEQVKLFKSDFRVVADYFVQMREKGFYQGTMRELKHVYETLELLKVMSHNECFQGMSDEKRKDPEGVPNHMKGIMDHWFEKNTAEATAKAKAEGIAVGKAEGFAEGKAEGIAVGKAEGIAVGKAEGIAVGKAEGFAEGIAEGKKKMGLLMKKLFSLNRLEDAQRAYDDEEYCSKLMKEFAIV